MQRLHSRIRYPVLFTCVSLLLTVARGIAQAPEQDFRTTMRNIFQALTVALPLSLEASQFASPDNAPQLSAALQALSQNAEGLGQHGQTVPQHLAFRRQALVRDARLLQQQYASGDTRAARFTLQRLTEHCFACHSKLPSQSQFDLGQRFLQQTPITQLALKDRARLAVATRQFDTALDTYETLLRSSTMTAGDIDMLGVWEDYLKVAVRVRRDFTRPLDTLSAFQQRSDLPPYLRYNLDGWTAALKELYHYKTEGSLIPHAKKLIREGQLRNRFPADRLGLVHFVLASSLLHRYADTSAAKPPQMAEAYYLLGVAESYIARSLWLPETAFFLETAIRLAPQSAQARQAFAFLEEHTIAGFTGSAGLSLPPDVQQHLEELRRLAQGS